MKAAAAAACVGGCMGFGEGLGCRCVVCKLEPQPRVWYVPYAHAVMERTSNRGRCRLLLGVRGRAGLPVCVACPSAAAVRRARAHTHLHMHQQHGQVQGQGDKQQQAEQPLPLRRVLRLREGPGRPRGSVGGWWVVRAGGWWAVP